MALSFEDPFIQSLAEEHAKAAMSLQEDEGQRVMKSYKRVRQDLRDRLDAARAGTFTQQRLRSTLLQVDGALKAMNENLYDDMDGAAQSASELAMQHLVDELETWDEYFSGTASPLNIDVIAEATDAKELLINNYQASIDAYSGNLRATIARGLSDGVISQATNGEIMTSLGKTLLGDEWRLQRVVRTEIVGIYGRAKLRGMSNLAEDGIPDLKKTLYTPMDLRTAADSIYVDARVQAGDKRLIVNIDDPFEYKWQGKLRKYMAPPDRPNDRSIMIPYRKSWPR